MQSIHVEYLSFVLFILVATTYGASLFPQTIQVPVLL